MPSLRDKIADIVYTATDNYERGASPTCGSVADAILACIRSHGADEKLTVGNLVLRKMQNGNIWITFTDDGEGGEFDQQKLRDHILQFYRDNF